jgi:hypothetical protein
MRWRAWSRIWPLLPEPNPAFCRLLCPQPSQTKGLVPGWLSLRPQEQRLLQELVQGLEQALVNGQEQRPERVLFRALEQG